MFDFLAPMLKSLAAAAVAAGSAYAARQIGVEVPADTQSWLVDTIVALASGAVAGAVTYGVPNLPRRKDRQAKAA
jgi:hypothetical protein